MPRQHGFIFARPPRDTHQVLQPRSYIEKEEIPPVHIPDVKGVLADKYEVYDSGAIGELDLRALLKQYGERRIADQLAANWRGGTYVASNERRLRSAPLPGM